MSKNLISRKKRQQALAKRRSAVGAGLSTLAAAPLALAGGWIAYSALGINHAVPLPRAIDAEQKFFAGRSGGGLAYYVDTRAPGRPLVLIHSINAAGSSYEMRPLFNHYRTSRPVYALDLPGFGFSERSDRVYSPRMYEEAIIDLMEMQVKEPADIIALSLGSEFVARAALSDPELFHSLTFISPSGFSAEPRGSQDGGGERLYELFAFPLWARAFYDLIATRPSIQYFLQQSFEGPVDSQLADYAYATSHQPGAQYAPLYFVSGRLFTPDIRTGAYDKLTPPVLVLFDRDAFVSFAMLPVHIREHPNWHSERIYPTKGLPHWERPAEVTAALDAFWKEQ